MKTPDSFRRTKVIEEKNKISKEAKGQENVANSMGSVSDSLTDLSSGIELVAETIESTSTKINSSVQDVQAGVELLIDSSQETNNSLKDLSSSTSKLSDTFSSNISKLSNLLKEKFKPEKQEVIEPEVSETEEAFSKLPVPVEDSKLESAIKDLIVNKEDIDRTPKPEEEKKKKEPKNDDKEKDSLSKILGSLNKNVKTGFKSAYGMTNRIADMLFKYTITAALFAAKWAAIMLAVVLAMDLIMIHFKYWGKLFNEAFDDFEEKLGPLAPILRSIFATLEDVKKFWKEGDFGNLALAIVKGLVNVLENLLQGIQFALGKLLSSLLRAMGQDTWADELEVAAIEAYNKNTGYMPTEDELKLMAKVRGNDVRNTTQEDDGGYLKIIKARARFTGNNIEEEAKNFVKGGVLTQEQADKALAKAKEDDNKNTQLGQVEEQVKTEARLNNLMAMAEAQRNSPENLTKIADELRELASSIIDNQSVEVDSDYYKLGMDALDKSDLLLEQIPNIKPEDPKESQDYTSAENINNIQTTESTTQSTTNTANVQNNVANNKTVIQQTPVTGYAAPGMYKALEVN
ncbi:baseplate hub subunit [Proteus phage SJ_PmiM]|nr:baseplate hub subunit [Proteus phage SJ_PmiM]